MWSLPPASAVPCPSALQGFLRLPSPSLRPRPWWASAGTGRLPLDRRAWLAGCPLVTACWVLATLPAPEPQDGPGSGLDGGTSAFPAPPGQAGCPGSLQSEAQLENAAHVPLPWDTLSLWPGSWLCQGSSNAQTVPREGAEMGRLWLHSQKLPGPSPGPSATLHGEPCEATLGRAPSPVLGWKPAVSSGPGRSSLE